MAIYTSDGTKLSESNTDVVLPDPEVVHQLRAENKELRNLVDTAKHDAKTALLRAEIQLEQLRLAMKDSEEAKKDAERARILAIAALIISLLELLAMFLVR